MLNKWQVRREDGDHKGRHYNDNGDMVLHNHRIIVVATLVVAILLSWIPAGILQ